MILTAEWKFNQKIVVLQSRNTENYRNTEQLNTLQYNCTQFRVFAENSGSREGWNDHRSLPYQNGVKPHFLNVSVTCIYIPACLFLWRSQNNSDYYIDYTLNLKMTNKLLVETCCSKVTPARWCNNTTRKLKKNTDRRGKVTVNRNGLSQNSFLVPALHFTRHFVVLQQNNPRTRKHFDFPTLIPS